MKPLWKVLVKPTLGLTTEFLSLLGLDELADYGEFLVEQHPIVTSDLLHLPVASTSSST